MSESHSGFPNPFDSPPPPLPGEDRFDTRPQRRLTSGKAVAAFILGLFSLVFWIFAALPAIVLGLIAQSEVRQQRARLKGRGLAWLGVLLGVCGFFAPVVWFSWTLSALRAHDFSPGRIPTTARIVHLHLGDGVSEQPSEDGLAFFRTPGHSLKGLLDRLDRAREDTSVKAVVLTLQAPSVSLGQAEELWKAIREVVDAGKPVYAHVADVQTGTYAMVSGASRINVVPTDSVWLTGMQLQAVYLGELFDKIGVDPQMMQMGDFKAAGEMFTRTGPSEAASKNMEWLLDGLYGTVVDLIAKGRKLDPATVRKLIDAGPYEAERAKSAGLVDSVMHLDQFLDEIRKTHGKDIYFDNHYMDNAKNKVGAFGTLARGHQKDAIALIYAEGMIMRGYERISPFGAGGSFTYSGDLVKTLEEARNDGHVAAVVLRIDSPGGSAVASEEILRAVTKVQDEGIPVVVSMGSTAASGGYYIACKADAIFADASTITASIGVVGGKMATEDLWKTLGVNWHAWKRGANADLLDFVRPFTPEQRTSMEAWMGETYGAFKAHVQEGRGAKLKKPLEELAGGRVFTGAQAVELGLVDEIGGLRDAIVKAATLAKLRKGQYSLRILPEPGTFWESFFRAMRGEGNDSSDLALKTAPRLSRISLGGLHFPGGAPDSTAAILESLAPAESRVVLHALAGAKLLGEERVIALMPELSVGR